MGDAPDPRAFRDALEPALRHAARLARDLEGQVANRPKSGESTPIKAALTVADTASQEVLLEPVVRDFPDVALQAEEDTPTAARFADAGDWLVVVDPIDGTLRFYLEGLGPYAVMIGLAERSSYRAALLALPREGTFLDAVRGSGARAYGFDDAPRPVRARRQGHRVLISHDLPGAAVEVLLAAGLQVAPACGGAISVAPLLEGVRAGLRWVPNGSISTRGRIGALVAREAGALVCGEDGQPFPESIVEPSRALVVAADREDLDALQAAVAAARDA